MRPHTRRQEISMNRLAIADRLAWIAALLAGVAAAAGLGIGGLYRDAPFWAQQARGIDLATLFLAVPILVVGLGTARHGSLVGRLAATAGLLYLIYNYAIFAFSVAMNPLAAVYIAILGLAVWSLVLSLSSADLAGAGRALVGRLPRRTSVAVLLLVAALFGLLWLGQIATATTSGTPPADLARAGIPTNPVYALDLGLFLPLCVVAGVGLLRGARVAGAFALPMLIWLFLTSAGIVGGFAFAALAGDDVPLVVAGVVGGVGIAAFLPAAVAVVRAGARDGASATPAAAAAV
jgi:hypothetical protein